ncbi:TetR family transcriptional regulator C-terminal domain-containing protein [uncultured Paraglaciecola sp.]|jgi:TetR/AcrR family transcriptional regulator, transcriptional repressor of bet genes|uniref:TetR family transcriptional regulator C-terminal domain-containing protein n=1 Tax=uncultured Paraglaciecola sp. TaxID=1765024 RepID=UPI0025EA3726|nr:TetR family transcriptional regulator C-terminal domain-containing protein [uncultured Paraglaciecola sp.]
MTATNIQNNQRPQYTKAQTKFILATLDSLMDEGVDGCSVRKISERAGTAVGLINYHFGTLNDLLAATYLHLAYTLMDKAIEKSQSTVLPRQRLSFFIQETFGDAVMQRKILRAWVVFWSMIDRAPQIKQAHDSSNQAFRVFLQQSFAELNKENPVRPTPRLAAIGLTAIMDGLWLEWCLSCETFNSDEAILLCEQWVDAACK